MSEMVERVARAIAVDHYARRFAKAPNDPHVVENARCNGHIFYDSAHAAIEAMREPTAAMDEAGYQAMLHWPDEWHLGPPEGITSEWFQSRQAYQWMIDAALAP